MGAIFNLQTEMFVKVARGWLRSDLVAKWGICPYHWLRPMRGTEVSEALRRRASKDATITPPLLQGGVPSCRLDRYAARGVKEGHDSA
jgi:hypothetical protein